MKEKHFTALCLFVSLLGILIMYIADKNLEPKDVKIAEINLDKNYVAFNGTITWIKKTEAVTLIKVKDDTGTIDVVIFGEKLNISSLKTGMNVRIIGRPQKYKEKIEILPLKIVS